MLWAELMAFVSIISLFHKERILPVLFVIWERFGIKNK